MFLEMTGRGVVCLNRSRRAAAVILLILLLLSVAAAGAAGLYYSLVLISRENIIGYVLAVPIGVLIFGFIMSHMLFGKRD